MKYRMRFISVVLVASVFAVPVFGQRTDVAHAANQTGLDLFGREANEHRTSNIVLSPYSIERGLTLAFVGAAGRTRQEMAEVLHLPADDPQLAAGFSSLSKQLEADRGGAEWHAADRLYVQQGYPFHPEFLQDMSRDWGAALQLVDYRSDPANVGRAINAWVSDQTAGKITDLLPTGALDERTRAVIVDALYLKAKWQERFKTKETRDRPFRVAGGDSASVPTMHATEFLGYRKENGYQAVAVPYEGGQWQLLILLPDAADGLPALVSELSAESLKQLATLPAQDVSFYLPKFRLQHARIALKAQLEALGMKTAFDDPKGSADFSRMANRSPDDYLKISDVYHQVYLDVDETGTEAAAATGGVMLSVLSVMSVSHVIEVRVDHPFVFAIQDRKTGLCLFLGQITDPRG
ncbi:MAG TPA: serpin family protein [Opitutaceae bacterium]|nr:serpin family protein [Opitutaceae bacterium]